MTSTAATSLRSTPTDRIREAVTREVAGTGLLLDVGNGGVFDYDTTKVDRIVAVDLFLDRLPASQFPANVTARKGDALSLDEPDDSYEVVLEALLYHHLVGRRPDDSIVEHPARDRGGRARAAPGRPPGDRRVLRPRLVLPLREADVRAADAARQDTRCWEATRRFSSCHSPSCRSSSPSASSSSAPTGSRWAAG